MGYMHATSPVVETWARCGPTELLALNQRDPASWRIAWFLDLWYKESRTAVMDAEMLDLSPSYVAHAVQPRELATFLLPKDGIVNEPAGKEAP